MLRTNLFFVLLTFVLISCSKSEPETASESGPEVITNPEFGTMQDADPAPFEFEKVGEVTVETDFIPSYPAAFAKDDQGIFYYIDAQQFKMVAFDPADGSLIFSTGQEGEGPGDFNRPNSMMVRNDTIVVSNQSGTRIDYFSTDGAFLESRQLPSYISFGSMIGVSPEGYLMMRKSLMGEVGVTIMALNMDLAEPDTVYTIDILQAENIEVPQGTSSGASVAVIDDKLYVGNFYPYSLRIMNTRGEVKRVIERDLDRLVPPGSYESGGSRGIRSFGSVSFRAVLDDGMILASAMYPEEKIDPDQYMQRSRNGNAEQLNFLNTLDFYDAEGTLLYSVEEPVGGDYPGFGGNFGDDLFYDFDLSGDRPVLSSYRLIRNVQD